MPALTTDDAKTKRCLLYPFDGTRTCISTQCMAWRWDYFTLEHRENGSSHKAEGGGAARGYCGYAGPLQ